MSRGGGRIAKPNEVKDSVKDISQEFLSHGKAVPSAKGGGDGGANHDLAVGKGEDVGRGWILEVELVESATFFWGNEDNSQFRGKFLPATGGQASEGGIDLTTEKGEIRRVSALAILPQDADGFCGHDDL